MVFLDEPTRVSMRRGDNVPVTINVDALVAGPYPIGNINAVLQRVDPVPVAAAPPSWAGPLANTGYEITQYVDATDLSEGYIYQLDITFEYSDGVAAVRQTVSVLVEILTTAATNARGVTRKELRQTAGLGLGDLVLVRATANGTTDQFIDVNKLLRPREEYIGRRIYFVGGTVENMGQIRRITSANSATGSVQLSISLPEPTMVGDEAELWSRHELGWEPDDVNRLIRQAHIEAASHFQLSATADISEFDARDPAIGIPSSFVAVTGVEWRDPRCAEWVSIDRARARNAPGYWVDKANRTIVVYGDDRLHVSSRLLRVRGYIKERPLDRDGDVTNLNQEWLIARVKELMYNQLSNRTDNVNLALNMAAQFRQEAMVKRTMVMPRRAANVDWVG